MMMSTREIRRRALEKQEDDDNDNKVVGFLATNKQCPLKITKTLILVHKKSDLTCTPVYTTRRFCVFSKNIREKKKKPLPMFTPHNIEHLKDPKLNHKMIEANAKTYKNKIK